VALPGKAGRNYASMMSGAKRGVFGASPSAAKRGVFAQSPSAAKKGVFGFTPGSQKSTSPSLGSFRSTAGSGYTPGGDSFKNYSAKDQATMFRQAGGKDKFINMAMQQQAKYPRGLNFQKFLDDSKRFQTGQILGGKEVVGADGIMRLQMAGADAPMRDAQGRQILSMQAPTLTAQAPTLSQLLGDMARAGGDMLGGIAKLPGQLFEAYKQVSPLSFVMNQAKALTNPGDIAGRLQAAGPEAQRMYAQFMQQPGMTFQRAFEMATGQRFANGGVASL
tara:strand:- start:158 stop:988 length:831 start_codon:yes stop_codon:yes gene_type:complete